MADCIIKSLFSGCIYYSLILTTKEYMHNITAIEPKVCSRFASHGLRHSVLRQIFRSG